MARARAPMMSGANSYWDVAGACFFSHVRSMPSASGVSVRMSNQRRRLDHSSDWKCIDMQAALYTVALSACL